MEKRNRTSTFMWIGSILIALLVVGSLGFGAYRLYAMGWARGAASATDGEIVESPQMMPPLPIHHGYRMTGSPVLRIVFVLIVVGMVFRHFAGRMHPVRRCWPHGPARGWHHPYPSYPGCDPRQNPQNGEAEDETGGAV